jgi:hypothetical protein
MLRLFSPLELSGTTITERRFMEAKTIECRHCRQKHVLLRDSQSGMWELTVGHASISNSSWEYLEETWLDIHHGGCADKRDILDMRSGVMEAV